MRRLLTVLAAVLTMTGLSTAWLTTAALAAPSVSASTLADCLARHHVCVADNVRSALSLSQQDQLESVRAVLPLAEGELNLAKFVGALLD